MGGGGGLLMLPSLINNKTYSRADFFNTIIILIRKILTFSKEKENNIELCVYLYMPSIVIVFRISVIFR